MNGNYSPQRIECRHLSAATPAGSLSGFFSYPNTALPGARRELLASPLTPP